MENVLTRRLELFAPLPAEDRHLLDDVVATRRVVGARTQLMAEGEASSSVRLILDGLAIRYKSLSNGDRQIVAYLIPGDFCDLNAFLLGTMDHSVATMSSCTVVDVPRHRVLEMLSRPDIARALWCATLINEGTSREWLLNLGRRRACERLAHLFSELHARMNAAGLADKGTYSLPLVQNDLADTLGISPVHVNRCLQQLRDMNLLTFKNRIIRISHVDMLIKFSGFDPNYLHLGSTHKGEAGSKGSWSGDGSQPAFQAGL